MQYKETPVTAATVLVHPAVLNTDPLVMHPAAEIPTPFGYADWEVGDLGAQTSLKEPLYSQREILAELKRVTPLAHHLEFLADRYHALGEVEINTLSYGLGDRYNALRMALAVARADPNKRFRVKADGRLTRMGIEVPSNVEFESIFNSLRMQRPGITLDFSQYDFPSISANVSLAPYIPHRRVYRDLIDNEFGLSHAGGTRIDLARYFVARAIGVPIKPEAILEPIVRIDEADLQRGSKWDVLVVPNAKERAITDIEDTVHSCKSLTAGTWKAIFTLARSQGFEGRVGIIKGTTFQGYVRKVVDGIRQAGVRVDLIDTHTLDAFVREVLQARMIVGGDTGPMHVAADALRGAHEEGITIRLRHLFNASAEDKTHYGLALPGHPDARALYYRNNTGEINPSAIPQLTNFLFS